MQAIQKQLGPDSRDAQKNMILGNAQLASAIALALSE